MFILTLQGFANRLTLSQGLVVILNFVPGFSFLEPWADISERLRRYFVSLMW